MSGASLRAWRTSSGWYVREYHPAGRQPYYAVAYWFYLSALRLVPASSAAASFYLIPFFGVAASFLILGERLAPSQWVGAGIVLVAVHGVVQRLRGRAAAPEPVPG